MKKRGRNSGRLGIDGRALNERRRRIERIVNGDLIGKRTKEVIQAVQAAVTVACVMPAVTSG